MAEPRDALNSAVSNQVGGPALARLNAGDLPGFAETLRAGAGPPDGGAGGRINIVPGVVNIRLDSRQIAQAVVSTPSRGRSGAPVHLGGSSMTGTTGPSVA